VKIDIEQVATGRSRVLGPTTSQTCSRSACRFTRSPRGCCAVCSS